MSLTRTLWKCTFSPRLFKIYEVTWNGHLVDKFYEPKNLERWGDRIVISFAAIWSISLYAIPLVAIFLYQGCNSLMDNVHSLSKIAAGPSAILIASLAIRGYSRANNPTYLKFLKALNDAHAHYNAETRQELHKYDFEFWAWPADFRASTVERDKPRETLTLKKIRSSRERIMLIRGKINIFLLPRRLLALPCKLFEYIVAHTFAVSMIYPGCVFVINWALSFNLQKGRIDLIKQGGERFKLVALDNNEIDAMFVDRRNKGSNGNILVITCEGNCGFYETGIMLTPLKKGYSVLGWNHPGFGCSTGSPYPEAEENAVYCVMRFAIDHLQFRHEQIIVYGWSIGGYTATWAAMNYPSIRSLILDATFDDILPLAIMTMFSSLEGLVRNIIRDHFNLNIVEQLNRYNGPVLLIRRTDDEVVCAPSNTLSGNRGNLLLANLLIRRYPYLFTINSKCDTLLWGLLNTVTPEKSVHEKRCLELVARDKEKNNGRIYYPSTLGQDCDLKTKQQLVIFLVTMYMKDQPTSHCTSLAEDLFHPGWDPNSIISKEQNE